MTGGRGGYFADCSLRMTEAVLKPQGGAKAERQQLQVYSLVALLPSAHPML